MSISAKTKLHALERALFLKSRTMKSAGALGAVGALSALLSDLGGESIVGSNATAKAAFETANAELASITAALQAGAHQAALDLYAGLVSTVPAIHAAVWEALPAEIRGHEPTDPDNLVDAATRAIAILNF